MIPKNALSKHFQVYRERTIWAAWLVELDNKDDYLVGVVTDAVTGLYLVVYHVAEDVIILHVPIWPQAPRELLRRTAQVLGASLPTIMGTEVEAEALCKSIANVGKMIIDEASAGPKFDASKKVSPRAKKS
jgi:hypothetical protein